MPRQGSVLIWKETRQLSHRYSDALKYVRRIQLLPERLSYKREKAYTTMSKVIMGYGSFCSCLIEPQGVSAWFKEAAQTRVFLLSRSLLLNHLEPQSSKTKLFLPIMPIDIFDYAFILLWDNLCRKRCILQSWAKVLGQRLTLLTLFHTRQTRIQLHLSNFSSPPPHIQC